MNLNKSSCSHEGFDSIIMSQIEKPFHHQSFLNKYCCVLVLLWKQSHILGNSVPYRWSTARPSLPPTPARLSPSYWFTGNDFSVFCSFSHKLINDIQRNSRESHLHGNAEYRSVCGRTQLFFLAFTFGVDYFIYISKTA